VYLRPLKKKTSEATSQAIHSIIVSDLNNIPFSRLQTDEGLSKIIFHLCV